MSETNEQGEILIRVQAVYSLERIFSLLKKLEWSLEIVRRNVSGPNNRSW